MLESFYRKGQKLKKTKNYLLKANRIAIWQTGEHICRANVVPTKECKHG